VWLPVHTQTTRPTPQSEAHSALAGHALRIGLIGTTVAVSLWLALAWGTAAVPADKIPWYVVRSAGLVAYSLLWLSVILGLWISSGLTRKANALLVALHEFTSLMALIMTFLHAVTLYLDAYLQPSWFEIWVPLAMTRYRPLAVGAGQIGLYLMVVIVLSFYMRPHIGARAWRWIHTLTFLLYGLVLIHAVTAGTDTDYRIVQGMYLATGGVVLFLTYVRAFTGRK